MNKVMVIWNGILTLVVIILLFTNRNTPDVQDNISETTTEILNQETEPSKASEEYNPNLEKAERLLSGYMEYNEQYERYLLFDSTEQRFTSSTGISGPFLKVTDNNINQELIEYYGLSGSSIPSEDSTRAEAPIPVPQESAEKTKRNTEQQQQQQNTAPPPECVPNADDKILKGFVLPNGIISRREIKKHKKMYFVSLTPNCEEGKTIKNKILQLSNEKFRDSI